MLPTRWKPMPLGSAGDNTNAQSLLLMASKALVTQR
jgi:hypothetical protein